MVAPRLPSVRQCYGRHRRLGDRFVGSNEAPTVALPADYVVIEEPYPGEVNADIDRFVVYHAPTIEPDDQDHPDVRVRFKARADARRRSVNLRRVAGTIETRIGKVGVWAAYRPDRRTSPLSREVGEYPLANLAVREIVRLDRQSRPR